MSNATIEKRLSDLNLARERVRSRSRANSRLIRRAGRVVGEIDSALARQSARGTKRRVIA